MKGQHHGAICRAVGHIPVFVVEAHKEQHRQAHGLGRFIGKRHAAVVLRDGLRLTDQAFQVGVLRVLVDEKVCLDLIQRNDNGESP